MELEIMLSEKQLRLEFNIITEQYKRAKTERMKELAGTQLYMLKHVLDDHTLKIELDNNTGTQTKDKMVADW